MMPLTVWIFYTLTLGNLQAVQGSPAFNTEEECRTALVERSDLPGAFCWPFPSTFPIR